MPTLIVMAHKILHCRRRRRSGSHDLTGACRMREMARGILPNHPMNQLTPNGNRVLIVEDEIVVSFFIRTLCEERGLQVAAAATAAEALQLIQAMGPTLGAAII